MISTLLGRTTLRSPCGHDMDNSIIDALPQALRAFGSVGQHETL